MTLAMTSAIEEQLRAFLILDRLSNPESAFGSPPDWSRGIAMPL